MWNNRNAMSHGTARRSTGRALPTHQHQQQRGRGRGCLLARDYLHHIPLNKAHNALRAAAAAAAAAAALLRGTQTHRPARL